MLPPDLAMNWDITPGHGISAVFVPVATDTSSKEP